MMGLAKKVNEKEYCYIVANMVSKVYLTNNVAKKELHVIKLGGSCITEKGTYKMVRKEVVSQICEEIASSMSEDQDVIIVHGAGSFGHIKAKEAKLQEGLTEENLLAFAKVHHDVRELQQIIENIGQDLGLPLFSLSGASHFYQEKETVIFKEGTVFSCVERGLIPLLHGDTVCNTYQRGSIISADTMATEIALSAQSDYEEVHITHVGDYDGILEHGGALMAYIDPEKPLDVSLFSEGTHADVTGGMYLKAKETLRAAQKGIQVSIINGTAHGRMREVLEGKRPIGTHTFL